ncbi:MAG: ABC transporter ATP-binding protein [Clostridia bacterium]|nr:ABC transporter ATP-binding protein [Clostridia bacterium]
MAGPMGPGARRPAGGPGRGPNLIMQKPKDFKRAVKFLWQYIKKKKAMLIIAFSLVFINIIASLGATNQLQPIIDNFLDNKLNLTLEGRIKGAFFGALTLLIFYLVSVSAQYFQMRIMLKVSQTTIKDLREDLFNHLQTLSVRYYDTHTNGEIMSRFTNDVDTLNDALNNSLTALFSSAVTLVGIISLMLSKNPLLTLVTLLIAPVLFFASRTIMSAGSKYFKLQQKNLGAVNGYIEETITGQKVVKVFSYEERAKKEFKKLNDELRKSAISAQSVAGSMMPVMSNLNNINYSLIAMIGGMFALGGYLSVGGLVVFLSLARQFAKPINEASQQFNAIVSAVAGTERICDVFDEVAEISDVDAVYSLLKENDKFYWVNGNEKIEAKGEVKFIDVDFSYVPEKQVLKKANINALSGQKIAFVGSTGAGKTTITNLITRFYDITDGKILIDNIEIKKIKRDELRKAMAVVLQDTHLFTGTVMENIRYGRLDATDEEVIEAAKNASAHSFITKLPMGYNTLIEGDGANLSQGQRQLLNISRAAIANTPILIFDEATSSVDTMTERLIDKGLEKLMRGKTTFVIAHRLSTVRNADIIMVLEMGQIIEAGTHDELIKLGGKYKMLYDGVIELD